MAVSTSLRLLSCVEVTWIALDASRTKLVGQLRDSHLKKMCTGRRSVRSGSKPATYRGGDRRETHTTCTTDVVDVGITRPGPIDDGMGGGATGRRHYRHNKRDRAHRNQR